jgi:hypothetical protein
MRKLHRGSGCSTSQGSCKQRFDSVFDLVVRVKKLNSYAGSMWRLDGIARLPDDLYRERKRLWILGKR